MPIPLLSKLRGDDQNKVGTFNEAGRWDARERDALSRLSKSIATDSDAPDHLDIASIPDAWARPLLFEMALYDNEHLLHQRVRDEWRGLLAMLALKNYAGLRNLTTEFVEIPRPSGNDVAANASSFANMLGELAPSEQRSLSSDVDWYHLWILLYDGRAVGMTSPTTLVCTATDYWGALTDAVPWFDGKTLQDPVGYLNDEKRGALADWVRGLREGLGDSSEVHSESPYFNDLLRHLDAFVQDLGGSSKASVQYGGSLIESAGHRLGIYSHISRPLQGQQPRAEDSHVRLRALRDDTDAPVRFVVGDNIAAQWDARRQEVLVWGQTSLADVLPVRGPQDQVLGQPLPNDMKWRHPQDFFTDQLFAVDQQEALPGAFSVDGATQLTNARGDSITPLLPLNQELLRYLEADHLRRRVRFEQSSDGITVRLILPLAGYDGQSGEFEVRRTYRFENDEIKLRRELPVLSVWPNFRRDDWQAYFTYFSTADQEDTFRARPFVASGAHQNSRTLARDNDKVARAVHQTTCYPRAMTCVAELPNSQLSTFDTVDAGLLLLDSPEQPRDGQGTWRVGVDFGTTGTNAYARHGNTDPHPLTLEDRFRHVTDTSDLRRSEMYDYHLPPKARETPFLSIFHMFENGNADPPQPLLDGHILFLAGSQEGGTYAAHRENAHSDLKWSPDPRERVYAGALLEQICLQCAAEAASAGADQIEWSFSFPTAFSNARQQEFRQKWHQLAERCAEQTGLASATETPQAFTESIASALFFRRHHNAATTSGVAFIDIGGGTSDVAIWQEDTLRWQSSLRYAGRSLFLDAFYERPELVRHFDIDPSRLQEARGNRTAFYAEMDALLSEQGDQMLDKLVERNRISDIQKLKQVIALGLSGLFYYVGLILRHLIDEGVYEPRIPDVYVGGNGSKMLHWLGPGHFRPENDLNDLFKNLLLAAARPEEDGAPFRLTLSDKPKGEAGYGLVCNAQLDEAPQQTGRVLAGESFRVAGEQKRWDAEIDDEMIARGLAPPDELAQLERLVEVFNRFASNHPDALVELNYGATFQREVHQQLANELNKMGAQEAEALVVEPTFMLEMKKLLGVVMQEWSSQPA